MNGSLFYSCKLCHLSLRLGDIMYFSLMFTWLFLRIESTLTKFSLLCKISKCVRKYRVLVLDDEAILTYRPLKNTFITFYEHDSATYELLTH